MTEFTTNQWAVLFLVLVLGWLLGLMSQSGSGRWRRQYEAERDARLAAERDHQDRLTAERHRDERLEVERTRDERVIPLEERPSRL